VLTFGPEETADGDQPEGFSGRQYTRPRTLQGGQLWQATDGVRDEQREIPRLLTASMAEKSSKAYKQQDFFDLLALWTGIAIAPLAIQLFATVWFARRRVRNLLSRAGRAVMRGGETHRTARLHRLARYSRCCVSNTREA
jgi:hypothetical protein